MTKRRAEVNSATSPKVKRVTKNVKRNSKNGIASPKTPVRKSAFAAYLDESKLIKDDNIQEKGSSLLNKDDASLSSSPVQEVTATISHATRSQRNSSQDIEDSETSFAQELNSSSDGNLDDVNHQKETDCQHIPELIESTPITNFENTEQHDYEILSLASDSSRVLLGIMERSKDVKIFGCGYVQVIKGCMSILGHRFTRESGREKFYAPVSHCALVIDPIIYSSNENCKDVTDNLNVILTESNIPEEHIMAVKDILEKCDVVVLLSTASDEMQSHTYPGYSDLYKVRSSDGEIVKKLCSGAYIVKTEKYFECFPCYEATCSDIISHVELWKNNKTSSVPVILTAGGKNSGKSTFNRYLINNLLPKCEKVCYLECDIGQPEFTPPGFVSATHISSPILGPPFTHIQSPLFSVYHGNTNAAGEPDLYIESIRRVFEEIQTSRIPVVVNLMGWNRGLGLNLLLDTIQIVQPTCIVQINSQRESKNLPLLSREYVSDSDGWMTKRSSKTCDFTHLMMNIDIQTSEIIMYNPSDLRNLRLLSYMDELQRSCCERDGLSKESKLSFSTFCNIQPYRVRLSDVLLCVAHETGIPSTHALALFNASLVGLCVVDKAYSQKHKTDEYLSAPPVCKCVGLGIVRGVDRENDSLYIISHLQKNVVENVNCLTLGVLSIPECLYQQYGKKLEVENDVLPPYISEDFPFKVKGSSKFRVYRNFINKTL